MALPTLVYDASGGSDTAASGAGPATAVTGTAAAHTGGVSSTTITLTNSPDLSGVASDGSHVIWLNTSSGSRHLSKITAVDDGADTVTVEDSFNIDSGSAVDYAIGGKRKTLENDTSRRDPADGKGGWIWEFENGTYTVTGSLSPPGGNSATHGASTIFRSAAGHSATITTSSAVNLFELSDEAVVWRFESLILTNTDTTAAVDVFELQASTSENVIIIKSCDCLRDHTAGTVVQVLDRHRVSIINSIIDGGDDAISVATFTVGLHVYASMVRNANGVGLAMDGNFGYCVVRETVFRDCNIGLEWSGDGRSSLDVFGCIFYSNTNDGLSILDLATDSNFLMIRNSIFDSNGGFGIDGPGSSKEIQADIDYNAFRNNTSGDLDDIDAGANDVTLTADPFVDAANGDFSLNDTAGGGADLKQAGFPEMIPGGPAGTDGFATEPNIGAWQENAAGGGGGMLVHPGMVGGMRG